MKARDRASKKGRRREESERGRERTRTRENEEEREKGEEKETLREACIYNHVMGVKRYSQSVSVYGSNVHIFVSVLVEKEEEKETLGEAS